VQFAATKKKSDQIDASKITDCLRCDFLPESHMMPPEIRDRRRALRYRHLLVRQMAQMKNRVSGLLMETGGVQQAPAERHTLRAEMMTCTLSRACPGYPCPARQMTFINVGNSETIAPTGDSNLALKYIKNSVFGNDDP
jgi:transposase